MTILGLVLRSRVVRAVKGVKILAICHTLVQVQISAEPKNLDSWSISTVSGDYDLALYLRAAMMWTTSVAST